MDPMAILSFLVPIVGGGVIWGVRQEGRINGHDKALEHQKERHDELRADIQQLDRKFDDLFKVLANQGRLNGGPR